MLPGILPSPWPGRHFVQSFRFREIIRQAIFWKVAAHACAPYAVIFPIECIA
jgi:hypothetical protein